MRIQPLFIILVSAGLMFVSCKEPISGNRNENLPPTTKLTVESINRGSDFRLSSQLKISWFGTDPDGYVIGYEYAINDTSENAWTYTTKTDSTFILPITAGDKEADVLFKVRAVDNDSLRDPVGARLVYPIVNSKPTVAINRIQSPPDTLFSVSSFGWSFDDPDGLQNIIRTEIAVNDTVDGWVSIPFTEENEGEIFISLEVDNSSAGEKEAQVFVGRSYSTLEDNGAEVKIPGVKVGEKNMFYVRAVDAAEEASETDTLSWFIKEQKSRVLFLNDFASSSETANKEVFDLHLDLLRSAGIEPDVWTINDGVVVQERVTLSEAFPTVIDPTLRKTLAKWDHVYWISNDLDRNIVYAQDILADFIKQGGTMFVNIPVKRKNLGEDLFNFLPVDSLGIGQFLLDKNSEVQPVPPVQTVLKMSKNNSAAIPVKGPAGSTVVYNADYLRRLPGTGAKAPYDGFKGVAVQNPEGNLVYFALDFRDVNANNNLDDMIEEIVADILGFKN